MAVPLEVTYYGHPRFLLNALNQALAAARHDHIDVVSHTSQHVANRGAIDDRHELYAFGGQAHAAQPLDQTSMNRRVGMPAFGAATQNDRISRLQAQRPGIRRHVGTTLVDDPDDAQGHSDALDVQAIGSIPLGSHRPHRIRQPNNLLDAPSHRLDAPIIEQQPVQ